MSDFFETMKAVSSLQKTNRRVYMNLEQYKKSGLPQLLHAFPNSIGYCGKILDTEFYVSAYIPAVDGDGNAIAGIEIKLDEPAIFRPLFPLASDLLPEGHSGNEEA